MAYEYLNDMEFIKKLEQSHLRATYAKIVLLSFDEKSLGEIQGRITAGTVTVNGSSAVRRTMNLTMLASTNNSSIENVENEIAIDKKIQLFVGLNNPLVDYQQYGEIVWFPQGVFILSSANVSRSTSSWQISISGKDKMCKLDGTCGGTLPATTIFHESQVEQADGTIVTEYPTISRIIYEAVNHWGDEPGENIIITDLDEQVKLLVRYMGESPIYFSDNYQSFICQEEVSLDFPHMYTKGEDVGYKLTDFTYPGELILKPGDTVVTLLNKIKETLGNFEYYYDVWGHFIFQQIKNYLNTASPLTELSESDYTKSYNNAKYLYSLTDLDTTTAVTKTPKYDNVKNDFLAYGERETAAGVKVDIRYHLVIDAKPIPDLINSYMSEVSKDNTIVLYDFNNVASGYAVSGYKTKLIGKPCDEWREELYRRALNAQVTNSVNNNSYDAELLAEWRKMYDTMNDDWVNSQYRKIGPDGSVIKIAIPNWNPDVFNDPGKLNYWLDFIDSGSAIGVYSVGKVGRRTKVVSNKDIKTIYNKEVPDIVFMEGYDSNLIAQYAGIGQRYFVLNSNYYDLFRASSTGASCFDQIREMMYQNLSYNTTVTITCLPKYYMEPNNIIYVEDKETGIVGNFQITQFSLPLTYNGTMSITATEVLTRV